MSETTLWGMHAGKYGDADSLFFKHNVVALGWDKLGDLSRLSSDRESFKQEVLHAYPNKKPNAVANNAGQLYRFIHEMKNGDLIAYPAKKERMIHIGRIISDYIFNNSKEPKYPHHRAVEWLKKAPRTNFSQGALYEVGSASSFFQVRNYADEFIAVLEGDEYISAPSSDDSVAIVTEEIEESTRDFVIKTLARDLKGHLFEDFIAHLLNQMGYRTRVAPEGPDGGIDIIAHRDELGFEPPIIKVQVKSSEGSIGEPTVSALYGKVDNSEYGLLVTLGYFTKQAINFSNNKANLRLIDGNELVDIILMHYEKFSSKYKGVLPLKSIYVPQKVDESEE
jgi:restriction system protein